MTLHVESYLPYRLSSYDTSYPYPIFPENWSERKTKDKKKSNLEKLNSWNIERWIKVKEKE